MGNAVDALRATVTARRAQIRASIAAAKHYLRSSTSLWLHRAAQIHTMLPSRSTAERTSAGTYVMVGEGSSLLGLTNDPRRIHAGRRHRDSSYL